MLETLNSFFEEWAAHRQRLEVGFAWRYQRFLLVAVDESRAGASGCSIDDLTDRLRELEAELALSLLDSSPVWYRDPGGRVRTSARAEFQRLAEGGEVGPDTTVFDLSLIRLGDLREGRWELPAARSWHSRLL